MSDSTRRTRRRAGTPRARTRTRARTGRAWPALGVVLLLPLVGCSDLLDVTEQEFLTPELIGPEQVDLLVGGAIGDFQVGYAGQGTNSDRYLSSTAILTDEWFSSGTFTTRTATDQRTQFPAAQGNTSDLAYSDLHRARRAAIRAAQVLAEVAEPNDPRIAEMKIVEGFTTIALGEGFCSNVPFSDVAPGGAQEVEEFIPGEPLSTEQIFERAVGNFDEALAIDPGSHAAAVGKARALLNNASFQEAAAAVSGVPTSFVRFIEHSVNTTRQSNNVFALQANGRYSVGDGLGGNGLDFRSAQDPRIPWAQDPGGGFDAQIPLFINLKYPSQTADVVLADGVEARLIEAEAALNAGDPAWLDILNELRADVAAIMAARVENYAANVPGPNNPSATLDPLSDPGTQEARVDLIFRERAFWMFNTGHRLGDMRRLIRQYGRSADEVFPTGSYFKGGNYGNDVNLVIPFDETNNPNFNLGMCDVTQA